MPPVPGNWYFLFLYHWCFFLYFMVDLMMDFFPSFSVSIQWGLISYGFNLRSESDLRKKGIIRLDNGPMKPAHLRKFNMKILKHKYESCDGINDCFSNRIKCCSLNEAACLIIKCEMCEYKSSYSVELRTHMYQSHCITKVLISGQLEELYLISSPALFSIASLAIFIWILNLYLLAIKT